MRKASRPSRRAAKVALRAMPALAGWERVLGAVEGEGEGAALVFTSVGWVVGLELVAVVAGSVVGLGVEAVLGGWALQVVGCAAAFAVTCRGSLLDS